MPESTVPHRVRAPLAMLRAAALAIALHGGMSAGLGVGLALAPTPAMAKDAPPAAEDPVLEKRLQAIASELRCLVCQNETIAGSNAELAVDLRRQVRDMLREGKTEREIIDYMTARYGDFVLYRPPVKTSTALLWFGPAVLLVGGMAVLWLVLRRRSRLAPEDFEPDLPDDAGPAADGPPPRPAPAKSAR